MRIKLGQWRKIHTLRYKDIYASVNWLRVIRDTQVSECERIEQTNKETI